MASDRASPPALMWVALFLTLCAALGLWMGFKDQIRRNPPDWYTGASSGGSSGPAAADTAREATPYDPTARNDAPAVAAATPAKPAEKTGEDEDAADDTATTTAAPVTTATPAAPAAPGTVSPATPRPKATPQPARPSDDPVGDILDSQKPAPDQPPVVPY
jgi:hypothetical protein